MADEEDIRLIHLLTVRQVAAIFAVDPKTVTRWAARGKIPVCRTPGRQLRFHPDDVDALVKAQTEESV